jgi:4a-hydroxytetrahydrobiopterin dehydratase
MTDSDILTAMRDLEGWSREGDAIVKTYRFRNYHETMAFVNATAWISHRQDHHPDLTVGYNQCTVTYTTHSAGGLSAKDFECATKVDSLFAL